jgi:hypothetical protein
MTRKFSISLPDEVAAVLDGVDNASAYIAEAIRRQDRRDRTRDVFARRGVTLTEDGIAAASARLRAAEARRRRPREDA